jgi:hypothetical protein
MAFTAAALTLLLASPASPTAPACGSVRECVVVGTTALRAGRMNTAEAAFERQAQLASCGGETPDVVLAHNNLAVLALRRGRPLEAQLWAGLALEAEPGSKFGARNVRDAHEAVAQLPSGEGVTGTYWCRWGDALGHDLVVEELPGSRIRFEVQAVKVVTCDPPDYRMGGATGTVDLKEGVAVWRTDDGGCTLRFTFGADEVAVTQDGLPQHCGFGGEVNADGTYRRVSRERPRFPMWGER